MGRFFSSRQYGTYPHHHFTIFLRKKHLWKPFGSDMAMLCFSALKNLFFFDYNHPSISLKIFSIYVHITSQIVFSIEFIISSSSSHKDVRKLVFFILLEIRRGARSAGVIEGRKFLWSFPMLKEVLLLLLFVGSALSGEYHTDFNVKPGSPSQYVLLIR